MNVVDNWAGLVMGEDGWKSGILASGNPVTVYGDERWQVSLESR